MYEISKVHSAAAPAQRRDTLSQAVAVAIASEDVSKVTITNLDTGKKIRGKQILKLAKRLEDESDA